MQNFEVHQLRGYIPHNITLSPHPEVIRGYMTLWSAPLRVYLCRQAWPAIMNFRAVQGMDEGHIIRKIEELWRSHWTHQGAFAIVGPIFQEPCSSPASAQTVGGIARVGQRFAGGSCMGNLHIGITHHSGVILVL